MRIAILKIVLLLAIICPSEVLATSTLTLSSSGEGIYLLQGVGIEKAGSFNITITYNSQALSNPRVDQGSLISGAMIAVNPSVPGILRIAIIRTTPIEGTGTIARIIFGRQGVGDSLINSMVASLSTVEGKPLSAVVQVSNTTDAATSTTSGDRTDTSTTTAAPAASPKIVAQQVVVTEQTSTVSDLPAVPKAPVEPILPRSIRKDAGPALSTRESTSAVKSILYSQTSVLDRFRTFKGERSAAKLIALFDSNDASGFTQEPSIAFSNGSVVVKVTIITSTESIISSDIAVMGARLLSIKRDPDHSNMLIAELAPIKGECSASLTLPQQGRMVIYSLIIAPDVNIDFSGSGKIANADFDLYLKNSGNSKDRKYDLNKDGRQDYVDDYIFVANYLVKKAKME